MLAPLSDYYLSDDPDAAIREMLIAFERQRIFTEARLANQARRAAKKEFKSSTKSAAGMAKATIQLAQTQLDTAIKGAVREKLEQVISEKLPLYDNIIK